MVVAVWALILCSRYSVAADAVFEKAFNGHTATMLLIDPANGDIVRANPAASRFYGFSRETLQSMSIQQINQLSSTQVAEEIALAKQEGRNFFIFRHQLADGDIRTVEVHSIPITMNDRKLLFSIIQDISEKRKAADALWHYQSQLEDMVEEKTQEIERRHQLERYGMIGAVVVLIILSVSLAYLLSHHRRMQRRAMEAERRQREIIWGTNVGTWEWNVQTGQTWFNERWAEIVGYRLEELEPISIQTWLDLCHPGDLEHSGALLEQVFTGESDYYECEARMRHKSGEWVWVLDRGKVVEWTQDGKPLRMSGTHQDITEQALARERIQYLANHDPLTGLPGLRLLKELMPQAFSQAKRTGEYVAVLFVDLDGFKVVNDSYGHEAGDAVLKEVAARLQGCLRESDTVARIGGDEFLIILSGLQIRSDATTLSRKVIDAVSEGYNYQGAPLSIGASVGIALFPEHGEEVDAVIRHADQAMYVAKRNGKGRCEVAGQQTYA